MNGNDIFYKITRTASELHKIQALVYLNQPIDQSRSFVAIESGYSHLKRERISVALVRNRLGPMDREVRRWIILIL